MNIDTITWICENTCLKFWENKSILEIGSLNENGSIRPIIELMRSDFYIGLDIKNGKGVDVKGSVYELSKIFNQVKFDRILMLSCLEHLKHWHYALTQCFKQLKEGGFLILAVPAKWPYHAYPEDYWRFDARDLSFIFANQKFMIDQELKRLSMSYAIIRKKNNLINNCAIYSIINNKKIYSSEIKYGLYFLFGFTRHKIKNILMFVGRKLFHTC